MSIVQQQRDLESFSDDMLVQESKQPSGQYPLYLVASEIDRRADLRRRFQQDQQKGNAVQPSVLDQRIAEVMGQMPSPMGQGIGGMAQPNPQVAQAMQGGPQGVMGFAQGGRVPDDEPWWQKAAERIKEITDVFRDSVPGSPAEMITPPITRPADFQQFSPIPGDTTHYDPQGVARLQTMHPFGELLRVRPDRGNRLWIDNPGPGVSGGPAYPTLRNASIMGVDPATYMSPDYQSQFTVRPADVEGLAGVHPDVRPFYEEMERRMMEAPVSIGGKQYVLRPVNTARSPEGNLVDLRTGASRDPGTQHSYPGGAYAVDYYAAEVMPDGTLRTVSMGNRNVHDTVRAEYVNRARAMLQAWGVDPDILDVGADWGDPPHIGFKARPNIPRILNSDQYGPQEGLRIPGPAPMDTPPLNPVAPAGSAEALLNARQIVVGAPQEVPFRPPMLIPDAKPRILLPPERQERIRAEDIPFPLRVPDAEPPVFNPQTQQVRARGIAPLHRPPLAMPDTTTRASSVFDTVPKPPSFFNIPDEAVTPEGAALATRVSIASGEDSEGGASLRPVPGIDFNPTITVGWDPNLPARRLQPGERAPNAALPPQIVAMDPFGVGRANQAAILSGQQQERQDEDRQRERDIALNRDLVASFGPEARAEEAQAAVQAEQKSMQDRYLEILDDMITRLDNPSAEELALRERQYSQPQMDRMRQGAYLAALGGTLGQTRESGDVAAALLNTYDRAQTFNNNLRNEDISLAQQIGALEDARNAGLLEARLARLSAEVTPLGADPELLERRYKLFLEEAKLLESVYSTLPAEDKTKYVRDLVDTLVDFRTRMGGGGMDLRAMVSAITAGDPELQAEALRRFDETNRNR